MSVSDDFEGLQDEGAPATTDLFVVKKNGHKAKVTGQEVVDMVSSGIKAAAGGYTEVDAAYPVEEDARKSLTNDYGPTFVLTDPGVNVNMYAKNFDVGDEITVICNTALGVRVYWSGTSQPVTRMWIFGGVATGSGNYNILSDNAVLVAKVVSFDGVKEFVVKSFYGTIAWDD